jgi:hypothetical protein
MTEQSTSTDSLIENIGRKVAWCRECETAEFTREETITNDKGKVIRVCEYCGERLGTRSADRAHKYVERPVLQADLNAPRSSVTRLFTSPWGRVKAHVSVHSYFAPFVELNGVDSPALKRLVDEEFGIDSIMNAMAALGVADEMREQVRYSVLVTSFHRIVKDVHLNPEAVPELNLDLVEAA